MPETPGEAKPFFHLVALVLLLVFARSACAEVCKGRKVPRPTSPNTMAKPLTNVPLNLAPARVYPLASAHCFVLFGHGDEAPVI
jgi:hypothetical protein